MIEDENAKLIEGTGDFEIVIPVSEIRSANIYDPKAHALFVPMDTRLTVPKEQPVHATG